MMTVDRRGVLEGSAALAAGLALPRAAGAQGAADAPDHLLWYRGGATAWTQALPVGNGRLGAMVFGGAARERLQLNEDSLWSGGPYDPVNPAARATLPEVRRLIAAGRYREAQALADAKLMATPLSQMAYQNAGDLTLDLPALAGATIADHVRTLDLHAAMATTRFVADGIGWTREVLACPVHQVIAVRVAADRRGAIDLDVALTSPQPGVAQRVEGDTLILSGRNAASHGVAGALRFEIRVALIAKGGRRVPGTLGVRGADEAVVLVAIATSHRRFDDTGADPAARTREAIDRAARRGFARIARDAMAEHRRLYRGVSLDLGCTAAADQPTDTRIRDNASADDPALAALYFNYGRYLLIAASRAGTQAANLQGLWNDSTNPPWGSKYTININTQMNYWPAEPTALAECTAPLIAMVRELAQTGARTAREMYGARGWVAHHNTDLWRAAAPIDGARWGLWPMGGAWLCLHLWDRYDYGRDLAYLRSVYPLLRGAALFFLDTLQTDAATGTLVTSPSLSPENEHPEGAALCAGPAMDRQILRDLFARVGEAAAILGTDEAFAAAVAAARARLAPDRIGAGGQLQEWLADWDLAAPDPKHRHVSHLFALYPSWQIAPDTTPDLARAARRSLDLRGDESTGWATAWRINLWARLRDGERAHRILRYLLGPERTYPNMFDAHPPFQIDGNFGGTAAIAEMLMQSRGDDIMLLPALPSAWPSGSIRGLRARGACRVDLAWRDGRLTHATLTSAIAGERRVMLGDRVVTVRLVSGRPARLGPDLRPAGGRG